MANFDPTIEKMLQGIPFAGMGTAQELPALMNVMKRLINENMYTAEYIFSYCEDCGYNTSNIHKCWKALTGIDILEAKYNNDYYDNPSYVPAYTIAWGISKNEDGIAYYIVPWEYGYSIMKKNETDVPEETDNFITIEEAVDGMRKFVKKVFTKDRVVTNKLLKDLGNLCLTSSDVSSQSNSFLKNVKELNADEVKEYAEKKAKETEEAKEENLKKIQSRLSFDNIYNELLIQGSHVGKDYAKKIYARNQNLFNTSDIELAVERLGCLCAGIKVDF